MFDKRGIGQEIDWIIGIGLFLLSIVFIFILFKPGITPVYDSATLLNIIQDGFQSNINWEITTVPVFIYPAAISYGEDIDRMIELAGTEKEIYLSNKFIDISCDDSCSPENGDTKLSKIIEGKEKENIEIYYIRRNNLDSPPAHGLREVDDEVPIRCEELGGICEDIEEADGGDFPVNIDRDDPIDYLISESLIYVTARLDNSIEEDPNIPQKTKYLVTVSNKQINLFSGEEEEIPDDALRACHKIGDEDVSWPYSQSVALSCPVIYEVGEREITKGIDLTSFSGLNEESGEACSVGYECVKNKWGFPNSKDFKIKIENLPSARPTPIIDYSFPNDISPPSNINIFVRNFNSFVLTDDGTRIPVSVRLMIW